MKWLEKIRNFLNILKNKRKTSSFLLESPEKLYSSLIEDEKIESIINSVPNDFNKLEKAYYVYIELGKILKEDPNFVFRDEIGKNANYDNKIDKNFYGICKSISELYVSILKNDRIGIEAESVNKHIGSPISHVDTILKIDDKTYICNLISDLSRIKSSRRVNSFCFDLSRSSDRYDMEYLKRLRNYYGRISSLRREDIEKLDKKVEYSYFVPGIMKEDERGIYSDDTIEMVSNEMRNPELLKTYVFHGEDIPVEKQLKYKIDYFFENVDKILDLQGEAGYLEVIENYRKLSEKVLSFEEAERIIPYAGVIGNDYSNIISIIKLRPHPNDKNGRNAYYLFSKEDNKYKEKSAEELKEILEKIDPKKFKIVGNTRGYSKIDIEELEL